MTGLDLPVEYVVKIQGRVDGGLVDWLGPMNLAADAEGSVSTLSGIVTDQAGIVGLIRHLHGLGIVLLSVERVAPDHMVVDARNR